MKAPCATQELWIQFFFAISRPPTDCNKNELRTVTDEVMRLTEENRKLHEEKNRLAALNDGLTERLR